MLAIVTEACYNKFVSVHKFSYNNFFIGGSSEGARYYSNLNLSGGCGERAEAYDDIERASENN